MYIANENERKVYDQFYELEPWERVGLIRTILEHDQDISSEINADIYSELEEEFRENYKDEMSLGELVLNYSSSDILYELPSDDIAEFVNDNLYIMEDSFDDTDSYKLARWVKDGKPTRELLDDLLEEKRDSFINWLADKLKR
jgi:hypothetical protein